jgi:1-acyl-sn-glycerol-3-phosphate acyltransferase
MSRHCQAFVGIGYTGSGVLRSSWLTSTRPSGVRGLIFRDVPTQKISCSPLTAYPLPRIQRQTARACAEKQSPSGFAVLLGLCTFCAALLTLIPMVVCHPFMLLFDRRRRAMQESLAIFWLRLSFSLARLRVVLAGRPHLKALGPDRPVLFVANCQSPLDMFALSYAKRRMRFIVPSAALRAPFIGWVMSFAQWVGVTGSDRRGQMNALKDATSVLESGGSMCIFPEGAPSETGRMSPFSSAAFRAAKKAGVPVVPITIDGTRQMFTSNATVPSRSPTEPIRITIHAPIAMDAGDEKKIAELAFQAVNSGLPPGIRA